MGYREINRRDASPVMIPRAGIGSEFGLSAHGGYSALQGSGSRVDDLERVSFTANGRAALGVAARYAKRTAGDRRDTVLLPAYLCHSMIQPFVESGLKVRFYPVGSELSFDPSAVCDRVNDQTVAVMMMHYFGFRQPEEIAVRLTTRFPQVTIIDDRTHLLLSDLKAGLAASDSALAIYSPRKWGPFPDLGIVVWPRLRNSRVGGAGLLDRGCDWPFGSWRLLGMLLRALFFAWPSDALRRVSLWPFHKADAILDQRVLIRRASPVSRLLWRCWDWVAAWQARRENYQHLLDNWPSNGIAPLFGKLPESACPLGFPIRAVGRDNLRRHFISKGIFPPIHWLRPPQVSPDEFPEAAALAEQELTIPIDQRYGLPHMDCILEAICRA